MAQAGRSNHGDVVCEVVCEVLCVAASSWHVAWLCLEVVMTCLVVTYLVLTSLVLTSLVLTCLVQLRRGRLCLGGSVCALG